MTLDRAQKLSEICCSLSYILAMTVSFVISIFNSTLSLNDLYSNICTSVISRTIFGISGIYLNKLSKNVSSSDMAKNPINLAQSLITARFILFLIGSSSGLSLAE